MKHGGDLTDAMAHYGGAAEAWLDLSTGINPWPWPVPDELPAAAWQRLPSRADEAALVAVARSAYRVPAHTGIIAAPGTQALIQWLSHLAVPGPVAITGPTYHEHSVAWNLAGHEVVAISDLGGLPDHVRHVVVVNPNNPDGRIVDHAALARVAEILKQRGGWLVIDEAFADVAPAGSTVELCASLPVVILRSFGKFYGLAGLRLGFAIAPEEIAQRIAASLGPWPCSGLALAIGSVALRDQAWAAATRDRLKDQAAKLDAILVKAGFEIVGGTTLFRLVRHPRALQRHAVLSRQRIWCRSFDWSEDLLRFGLPPDDASFDRLAAALALGE